MDAICEHLEAITRGELHRLVINVPPGHSKSTLVSVCWPVWEWLQAPEHRWIFGSYELGLSIRDNVSRRALITSDRYAYLRPDWALELGSKQKTRFRNTQGGYMRAVSVGSGVTGDHADRIVVDDPIKPGDIYGPGLKDHTKWFDETVSSRFRDLRRAVWVVVMQRLHEKDLAGVLIETGDCEHLFLPASFVQKKRSTTSIGWADPRTKEGELLFPLRFPTDVLARQRKRLGPTQYSAQYQQDPTPPDDGNMFERGWWKRWRVLPGGDGQWLGSWDFAFEGEDDNDYVVGEVWYRRGADAYLVDQVRAKMTFTASKYAMVDFASKWPNCNAWVVETKANGPAIISELRRKLPGIIAKNPTKSKHARAAAVAPWVEAGNVYLPDADAVRPHGLSPTSGWSKPGWVLDFIEEHASFPRGNHDDQVDCASQALQRFGLSLGDEPIEEDTPPVNIPVDDHPRRPSSTNDRRTWRQRDLGR